MFSLYVRGVQGSRRGRLYIYIYIKKYQGLTLRTIYGSATEPSVPWLLGEQLPELCDVITWGRCSQLKNVLQHCTMKVLASVRRKSGTHFSPAWVELSSRGFGRGSARTWQPLVLSEHCNGEHSVSLHNQACFFRQNKWYFSGEEVGSCAKKLCPKCVPVHLTGRDTVLHCPEWREWLIAYLFKFLLWNALELKHYYQVSSVSQRRCKIGASN